MCIRDRLEAERERENAALEREKRKQAALLKIKQKYGKNAVLRGMNYELSLIHIFMLRYNLEMRRVSSSSTCRPSAVRR